LHRRDDPEDLAYKICRLPTDSSLASSLGHQAKIDGGERYDPGNTSEKSHRIFIIIYVI